MIEIEIIGFFLFTTAVFYSYLIVLHIGINKEDSQDPKKVLNGIAYDSEKDRLFITGKKWTKLFQIEVKKID